MLKFYFILFFSYQSTSTTTSKPQHEDLFGGVGIDFGQTQARTNTNLLSGQLSATTPTTNSVVDDNLFDPFAELSTNRQQQSATTNTNKTLGSATIPVGAFNINPAPPPQQQTSKQIPILSKPPGDSNSSLFNMKSNNNSSNQQFSTDTLINRSAMPKSTPNQQHQNTSEDLFSGLTETVAPKQQQNNSDFGQFDLLSNNISSSMNISPIKSTSNQPSLLQSNLNSTQNNPQQQPQNSGFGFSQQNSSSGIDSLDSVPRTVSSTPVLAPSSNNMITLSSNAPTSLIPQQNSGLDDLFSVFSSPGTAKSNAPMNTLLNTNMNSASPSLISGSNQQPANSFAQNNTSIQVQKGFASQNNVSTNSNIQGLSSIQNTPIAQNQQFGGFSSMGNNGNRQQVGFGGKMNMNFGNTGINNFQPQQNMNRSMNQMNQQPVIKNYQHQQYQQQQSYRHPQQQYQQQQQQLPFQQQGMQSNLNFINPLASSMVMNNQQQHQSSNRNADAFSFVQDAMKSSGNKK